MKESTLKQKIQKVLEQYSACDICQRDKTKLCEQSVPEEVRQLYFITIYPRWEDQITKRCRHFRLHKSKLDKVLSEMETEEW